mmetsp:Transcript_21629/g.40419  ORF Transcript_21629/g.40419 Transcript_21629/m.40419 type:complete len:224 (+) Transcript_21629:1095-1766(+)
MMLARSEPEAGVAGSLFSTRAELTCSLGRTVSTGEVIKIASRSSEGSWTTSSMSTSSLSSVNGCNDATLFLRERPVGGEEGVALCEYARLRCKGLLWRDWNTDLPHSQSSYDKSALEVALLGSSPIGRTTRRYSVSWAETSILFIEDPLLCRPCGVPPCVALLFEADPVPSASTSSDGHASSALSRPGPPGSALESVLQLPSHSVDTLAVLACILGHSTCRRL